jgi:acyl carrier protein
MPQEINQSLFVAQLKTRVNQNEKVEISAVNEHCISITVPKREDNEASLLPLIARHLNSPLSTLNVNKSLGEYGLDSLAAIHLAEDIKRETGITIAPTKLLEKVPILQIMHLLEDKEESVC